jgi:hypothetical protein
VIKAGAIKLIVHMLESWNIYAQSFAVDALAQMAKNGVISHPCMIVVLNNFIQ